MKALQGLKNGERGGLNGWNDWDLGQLETENDRRKTEKKWI